MRAWLRYGSIVVHFILKAEAVAIWSNSTDNWWVRGDDIIRFLIAVEISPKTL